MPKTFKFLRFTGKKAIALLALTIVLSVAVVGGTLAFIITKTNALTNIFTPAKVDINIDGNEVENTGDIPVYVRVAVVANWVEKDANGNVVAIHSTTPTVNIAMSSNWVLGSDGFYYYKLPVAAGDKITPVENVTSDAAPSSDYTLQVQVLSSAIQSTPTSAVINVWTAVTGVEANGNLIVATAGN